MNSLRLKGALILKIKKYKSDFTYSYTQGPFPTFEILENHPEKVIEVHISESFNEKEKLVNLCKEKNIPYIIGEKQLNIISDKDKCYASAIFEKYNSTLQNSKAHILLHNPSDMGNIGTIIRSALAFGIKDLAIIKPCADCMNPKVIRASMGAIFKINIEVFETMEDYLSRFKKRDLFPFMLTGETVLSLEDCPKSENYTLIFGNEARGLPKEFEKLGTAIFIPQSKDVDSLNLGISVAIASFIFTSKNK